LIGPDYANARIVQNSSNLDQTAHDTRNTNNNQVQAQGSSNSTTQNNPTTPTQQSLGPGVRNKINELNDYWQARYLTATEAVWRIFGFNITSKYPSVSPLPVHIPSSRRHIQFFRRNETAQSMSLLLRYFYRPQGEFTEGNETLNFETLKYTDYFKWFRLDAWDPQKVDGVHYFQEFDLPEGQKRMLVVKRKKNDHLTRLVASRPSEGERFYIRILLQHRSVRSFEQLRTADGNLCENFQLAAITLGLFADEREAEYALMEAVNCHLYTPNQLRRLFVDILINECSETPLSLWNTFKDHLSADFFHRTHSQDQAVNRTLEEISHQLEEYGKSLNNYGLPNPVATVTEVEHELERWAPHTERMRLSADRSIQQFNEDQRRIYERIMDSIQHNQPLCLFIDGKAGRGKTFLINTICEALRARGKIVIPTATSAFAAQLYAGGRTTHSAFKVILLIFYIVSFSLIGFRYLSTTEMTY
jgi:hypothetical protein